MGLLSSCARQTVLLILALHVSGASAAELLKDINTGGIGQSAAPDYLGAVPGGVAFAARSRGVEAIWKSDGTSLGTMRVKNLSPAYLGARDPIVLENKVIFLVRSVDSSTIRRLMVTDGTTDATVVLASISTDEIHPIAVLDGKVAIFHCLSAAGKTEVWRSDGTVSGTARLIQGVSIFAREFAPGGVAGKAYFGLERAAAGDELWETDGTPDGTRMVADIRPGPASSDPSGFATTGGYVYFTALEDDGRDLFRVRSSTGVLEKIADLSADQVLQQERIYATGGGLVFFQIREDNTDVLWRSDGTPSGTYALEGLDLQSFMGNAVTMGEKLYFPADSAAAGTQLWVSDGTVAGTHIIDADAGGPAEPVLATGSRVFFIGQDTLSGPVLWVTSGTRAGTRKVLDAYEFTGNCVSHAGMTATQIFWTMCPSFNPASYPGYELWVTNRQGTAATRLAVNVDPHRDYPRQFSAAVANERYFYALLDDAFGSEPAVSDGTPAGTGLLRDLDPQVENAPSRPRSFGNVGNLAIFTADDGLHGRELWSTNGTKAGTTLVKDINAGPGAGASSDSPPFLAPQGFAYIRAADDIHGYELWRTDGTTAGTSLVADIVPGAGSGLAGTCGKPYVSSGNFTFFSATMPDTGLELWRTNGTSAGTRRVVDLYHGPADSAPCLLGELDGQIYFTAIVNGTRAVWITDGTGPQTRRVFESGDVHETFVASFATDYNGRMVLADSRQVLWTDGTASGTQQLLTLNPAGTEQVVWARALGSRLLIGTNAGSHGRLFAWDGHSAKPAVIDSSIVHRSPETAVVGDRLAFVGYTVSTGEEVFFTDGTRNGLVVATDVSPEGRPLVPAALIASGSTLYFHAYDLEGVHQLWRTRGDIASSKRLTSFGGMSEDGVEGKMAVLGSQVVFGARDGDDTIDSELYVQGNAPVP